MERSSTILALLLVAWVVGAQAPGFSRELKVAKPTMHGSDVQAVQERLLSLGYAELGQADGWYGPKTAEAVRRFCFRNGLPEAASLGKDAFGILFSDGAKKGDKPSGTPPEVIGRGPYLFGGWAPGRGWIDPDEMIAWYDGAAPFSVSLRDAASERKASCRLSPLPWDNPYFASPGFSFADGTKAEAGEWILSSGRNPYEGFAVRPAGAAEKAEAQRLMADWLAAQGFGDRAPERLSAIVLDADADGKQDLLVEASRGELGFGGIEEGSYYACLLFAAGPNGVRRASPLVSELFPADVESYEDAHQKLEGIADLNGDGKPEFVFSWAYREGAGSSIFAADRSGAYKPVLSAGAGA